jgi:hypothetical protein
MHVWWGSHKREPGVAWWRDTLSVRLAGDWKTNGRKVLWVGRRFLGIQAADSPLAIIRRERA